MCLPPRTPLAYVLLQVTVNVCRMRAVSEGAGLHAVCVSSVSESIVLTLLIKMLCGPLVAMFVQ